MLLTEILAVALAEYKPWGFGPELVHGNYD